MFAEDAECISCSDCKLEFIEKRWTQLLLNWLNKCVHPKAPINELNPWSLVDVLRKYKQDIHADDIDDSMICSDVEAFVRFKYPLTRLRYYDMKEVPKKMYLMSSTVLFHCCINSITGMVDGDICAHLTKAEQEMILKFCEELMDMEVTCNNIELAIKEACNAVKQDTKAFKKAEHSHDQKTKQKTEPPESGEPPSPSDIPPSPLNLTDPPPAEGLKKKYHASKYKPVESCDPNSISEMPASSFNSLSTDVAPVELSATMESIDYDYSEPATSEVTPFDSIVAVGKSPTGSMRQKVTTTIKSVEYESFVPCSSSEMPSHITKTFSKSPTGSIVKRFNTMIKSVEYESYVENPLERSSYSPKPKPKYEYNESGSSIERNYYDSEVLDEISSEPVKHRRNTKYREREKYKSDSRSVPRSVYNTKDADRLPTEKRKTDSKSKSSRYRTHGQGGSRPIISINTSGKLRDEKYNSITFKSSVTVLPSVVTTDASFSEMDSVVHYSKSDTEDKPPYMAVSKGNFNVAHYVEKMPTNVESGRCLPNCSCDRCGPNGPYCGDPGISMNNCNQDEGTVAAMDKSSEVYYFEGANKREDSKYNIVKKFVYDKKCWLITAAAASLLLILLTALLIFILQIENSQITNKNDGKVRSRKEIKKMSDDQDASLQRIFQRNAYTCKNDLCQKVYEPTSEYVYSSLSRCVLLCMGPQLWPKPIGYTYFSKKVVILATNKLEYKLQSVPSEAVHMFLAEAFKLFLGDLAKLERYTLDARRMNLSRDSMIKKMYIQMDVETDPDPRLRLDTEESYTIKVETITTQVVIKLLSASFCGIRHALETLSQLILLDQTTGNLITLSNMIIKDAPSYKYRGLMLDTGRNFIPVPDIMRTVDAMASVKLNTLHWRISDVASFPLHLPAVPQLFEYGAYSRNQIYTKEDVKAVVRRAGIRGIRVLLEVAAPGPVGRAWSWIPEATCPTKDENFTCNNALCLRLGIHETVFDILQIIYSEILEMTKVDDVFHLSDGVFSLANCYNLMGERDGFLDKALERLKLANKGFLPKLPIIWYSPILGKDLEARTWDRMGVQLWEWHGNPSEQFLSRFRVIHSSRWELSCEVKKQRCKKYRTWQEMYNWKSWRNLDVFTIEGGEATLWTDLVDSGNLDYHLWPRAAAIAERLWSDITLNVTVSNHVYVRLDCQRWRMVLKSVQVQPIWPLYCSFSPGVCLEKLKKK